VTKPTLSEFRELYGIADAFRNEVEHFALDAGIPAQSQLRYAGWHLMNAIGDDATLKSVEHLAQGVSHCKRAAYEAAETGILFALEKIHKFKDDFAVTDTSGIFPNYVDCLSAVREAHNLIKDGRKIDPDRRDDWELGMRSFRKLRDTCDEFDQARVALIPVLEKRFIEIVAQDARNLKGYRWTIAGTLLGIFGILLTIVLFVLS
jgi:hypothetical protein